MYNGYKNLVHLHYGNYKVNKGAEVTTNFYVTYGLVNVETTCARTHIGSRHRGHFVLDITESREGKAKDGVAIEAIYKKYNHIAFLPS